MIDFSKLVGAKMQANALQQRGRVQVQPREAGAFVASVALSGDRLALLWTDGTLQCFSINTAASSQVQTSMPTG